MRSIPNYEGFYEIDETGKIFSVSRDVPSARWGGNRHYPRQEIKLWMNIGGYWIVTLVKNKVRKTYPVHRLVAMAYLEYQKSDLVRHLDGNPSNNSVSNLAYGTHKQNTADSIRHGTFLKGEQSPVAKLSNCAVSEIKHEIALGGRTSVLAREYRVSPQTICCIKYGRNWAHIEAKPKPAVKEGLAL